MRPCRARVERRYNMTINAGWTKTAKTLAPNAFLASRPVVLEQTRHVVFFDGQIKLMKGEHIRTWADFLRVQFYTPIEQALARGASVVVLGFDDYAHVPTAKTPTQRKRSEHVQALNFSEADELPSSLPEEWAGAMRNRVFKTKVVGLIVRNVAERFKSPSATHSVIIDWVGPPRVYGKPVELPALFADREADRGADRHADRQGEGAPLRRGECDVKAFAWSAMGMPLLIESTDGDFVPMSLLHLETTAGEGRTPSIFLHRLKTNLTPAKRTLKGGAKREYEFVHVNAIYEALSTDLVRMGQAAPMTPTGPGSAEGAPPRITPARLFAYLVACTGCDFSLSLPNIGPGKLWNMRNGAVLMPGVQRDRRAELWASRPQEVLLHMIIVMYADVYKKHCAHARRAILSSPEDSLDTLTHKYTRLYNLVMFDSVPKPRIQPWPAERLLAHVRNTCWTLEYWTRLHDYPDPLATEGEGQDKYGFVSKKGRVAFVGA